MGSIEEFEPLLKEVVLAKRLSASKMTKLTEVALRFMEHDTQLVSTLYRTHKSLSPSGKISSLYVFDALSRAARNQVNKQGLTGDLSSALGNCATFLLKVEGVLDGLFQDMVTLSHPDSKEKAKKILDIWLKSSTFPSAVLARLSKVVKDSGKKEPDKVALAQSSDPRQHQTTPPVKAPPQPTPTHPTANATPDVQSTLLALLSQAANAVASTNGQTTPNIATLTATSALDANQLALFQQLTQTAKAGGAVPTQPVKVPVSLVPSSATANVPPVAPPFGGPSQPLPYRDDHFGPGRRDPKYDSFNGPDRGRDRDEYHDERHDFRGEYRGGQRGGYRGRGRGRWDERDRHKDHRDRDWNAAQRSRPSRSRSPPRTKYGGGRRDIRPYSPRRLSVAQTSTSSHTEQRPTSSAVNGKDEFGRDLRPQSPNELAPSPQSHTAAAQSPPPSSSVPDSLVNDATEIDSQGTRRATSSTGQASQTEQAQLDTEGESTVPNLGLDAFDIASFNPTDPSSWVALGKAWTVSHGSMPSQEELMQYVMSGGMMGMHPMSGQYDIQQQGQWGEQEQCWDDTQQWNGSKGRGRGRGGFHRGNSRGGSLGYSGGSYGDRDTDAVTLGGGGDQDSYDSRCGEDTSWKDSSNQRDETYAGDHQVQGEQLESVASSGGGRAGRMEKVGDKWVFVRGEATPEAA